MGTIDLDKIFAPDCLEDMRRILAGKFNYSLPANITVSPDDLLEKDPKAYAKAKEDMIKSSKLYAAPKNEKLEYNDYE